MTDQFKNVKDEETFIKVTKKSPMQEVIDELEELTATSFREGNLIAHYTFNTAIEVVKKHAD